MDGIAVVAASTTAALPESPVRLNIRGRSEAGLAWSGDIEPGQTVLVGTGAALPDTCDAVIAVENVTIENDTVLVSRPVSPGKHIRRQGEDIRNGDIAIPRGTTIRTPEIALLAALGIATAPVIPAPKIAILSIGAELTEAATPITIPDSNGPMLANMAIQLGAIITEIPSCDGTVDQLRSTIDHLVRDNDLIISSGGISNSATDTMAQLLASTTSGELWNLHLRPGKHYGLGQFGATPLIALPGNPVAAFVGFELIARAAIDRLAGRPPHSNEFPVIAQTTIDGTPGRTDAIRAHAWIDENARIFVSPVENRGSGIISSLRNTNCLIILPEDAESIAAGNLVSIRWLDGALSARTNRK